MSYACKGITSRTLYEGRDCKIDLFRLNKSTVILDSHNNYKLTMTPVEKDGKPVLNIWNKQVKAYEVIRYTADKKGNIYVLGTTLPIYSYNKAVEVFELIRRRVKPTRWQQQYYEDRPHLFEIKDGCWCRIAYEAIVPIISQAVPTEKKTTQKVSKAAPVLKTSPKDQKREDKIREACDRAYQEQRDILDYISAEDLTYAMDYMDFDPIQAFKFRTKHPLHK